MTFDELPRNHFGAILADPPWAFETYSGPKVPTTHAQPYKTMPIDEIYDLPVKAVSAPNSVLFLWVTWPLLLQGLQSITEWGFKYKTCAFAWIKADASQTDMFPEDMPVWPGMGYWTRSNSEVCLLATKGKPKRVRSDVRQGIIAPRREHSRKPDGIHERIERLVAGPYLELFARQTRPGWTVWGNETTKFNPARETEASL
jgi:N6-adenosine-specific RNA methylase IME4